MSDTSTQPQERWITKTNYARYRGVSGATVSQYGKEQRLVLNQVGKVDWKATDRLLDQSLDPNRGGDRTGKGIEKNRSSAGAEFQLAKTQEAQARAQKTSLEVGVLAGELIKAKEVESEYFNLARQAQEVLRAIPDRLSEQLAAESDPEKIHIMLDGEIERVCETLSKDAEGG